MQGICKTFIYDTHLNHEYKKINSLFSYCATILCWKRRAVKCKLMCALSDLLYVCMYVYIYIYIYFIYIYIYIHIYIYI